MDGTSASYSIAVGEELSLHIIGDSTGPLFRAPLPAPEVAMIVSISTDGSTAVYRGVAPGTTMLAAVTQCTNPTDLAQSVRLCPVLSLTVY